MKNFIIILTCLLFTQALSPQNYTSSNLPLILIDTQGKAIPDEPKITALMKVINNPDRVNTIYDKTFEYDGYIGIETRGNTAQIFFEKKSFTLETRTDSGTNLNVSLLGMPEENDWVLHGPYSDKSLMRNALAYHLGNLQGRWSPRTRFCEVFVNNEYRGVYVLVEKIKIDKNRVNIAKILPEDNSGDELTGGYIMRIDRDRPGSWNSPFMGKTGSVDVPISYLDPEFDELTEQQKGYIREYITDFEYTLDGPNFKDPQLGYRAYADVISFVDYFIITEISRNLDGYRCSVYFHKDKDSKGGKLNMSPLWDYNLGFGNGNFMDAEKTAGWTADGIGRGDWYEVTFWWDRLMEDQYYVNLVQSRWKELRNGKFSNASIFEFIDSCENVLSGAQVRNFQKFNILNSWVWPNAYIGGSYFAEVDYLKTWIADRLDWLDYQIDSFITTSIDDNTDESIESGNVLVAYPNPFIDRVTLRFNLSKNANVDIVIRNVLGEKMMHQSKVCDQGNHEFIFESEDFTSVGNLFFYTLIVNGIIVQSGKMMKY